MYTPCVYNPCGTILGKSGKAVGIRFMNNLFSGHTPNSRWFSDSAYTHCGSMAAKAFDNVAISRLLIRAELYNVISLWADRSKHYVHIVLIFLHSLSSLPQDNNQDKSLQLTRITVCKETIANSRLGGRIPPPPSRQYINTPHIASNTALRTHPAYSLVPGAARLA